MFLLALICGLPGLAAAAPTTIVAEASRTADSVASRSSLDEILDALRSTESGDQPNGGRDAKGDGGHALGPYQIHRPYFVDAGVPGSYEDCRDPDYSRRVVIAYWKRWCPDALEHRNAEVLARIHNGGPQGACKASTLAYWRRVERTLFTASVRAERIVR